ncbi:MAG TPA: methyltransferase domain-containing protein [Desulfuromonadaceae bacterium]
MKSSTLHAIVTHPLSHRLGVCTICGRATIFFRTTPSARNGFSCLFCRSSSRNRHVAKVVLEAFPGRRSAASLMHTGFRAYIADHAGALARVLSGSVSSAYLPGMAPGSEISPGVTCQNLERLTFADESFACVITEDVLEHVRDYRAALGEIRRVLVPGGRHVFTIPFCFHARTVMRVDATGAEDVHLLPPEYHGDTIRGTILAYRTFGRDLFDELEALGFETEVDFSTHADRRAGIFDSFVFVSRKRGENHGA